MGRGRGRGTKLHIKVLRNFIWNGWKGGETDEGEGGTEGGEGTEERKEAEMRGREERRRRTAWNEESSDEDRNKEMDKRALKG